MKNIQELQQDWNDNPRWKEIIRPYSAEDVLRLRGNYKIDYTIAQLMAEKFWTKLNNQPYVAGLGALTGNQAVQEVDAGLEAIYLSGWQVAADANLSGEMYPDQSLYPSNSVPAVVKKINNALLRADQIQSVNKIGGQQAKEYLVPIIADAEAGFGGNLNAYELMKQMIESGAAGVHFEDQLSSAKKCGHLGGKVLVPTQEAINKLIAARLAADVCGTPTVIIARTDADAADLLTSDIDDRDKPFITGERTSEGFFKVNAGVPQAIARGLAYAPYADLLWMETSHPNLDEARQFAEAIHAEHPGKLLAYNCSPSFNWASKLSQREMETFREDLAVLGFKFQFITLAGFHALNYSMFELARAYREHGMAGYSQLQEKEFALQQEGFRAVKHQSFVGTGFFDEIQTIVTAGEAATVALKGSTEAAQF
ncbi:isocitrate lyase [Elizabethkingia meningoseptica]|uniref:Isocitrate lyase n=1 Tax=Elizabethkingia meningoseptica TaxID=238 RepID=A0A1T3GY90_ELIME|nr:MULTISPECIES: isocitrate lyase [Elizabethkingia]AQX03797.1 isocitrate lyase [Elizabethkingia meningoseptica]AQX11256.1 isocitrate lyase [Elizabethkingia meningoseptica]AQX45836.1 isocitrate lyase [Elizabethkingia meningoseptica]EOR30114.1 isocitrate lyase [Elizabethkingia meningoseptica ATCC 13253 = NBRC 12535]KUY15129.1 isocitrate lyase [Elizabethkingia meningoseptica]